MSTTHVSTGGPPDSHWASMPESGSTAWLWIMYLSYVWIGRPLFQLLSWPASWYFVAVRPVARRASIEYQRRVGVLSADASAWQAWRAAAAHVRRFADTLLDKALVWTGGLALDGIRREVDPRFDDAVDANRGGVLVVAHFGNLEVLRRMGERAKQLRLHILVHTRHAERFNRMLTRMNPQSAERLLQVTDVDTGTIAHLAARVELGDFVVIAADRVPVTSQRDERRAALSASRAPVGGGRAATGGENIDDERRAAPSASRAPTGGGRAATGGVRSGVLDVPFLGADAAFPIGPWVLAAALGCPVYWLACYQRPGDQGRYTLVCELMRERVVLPRKTRDAALCEVIADYVQYLERACREAPLAWFNFFSFWRTSK